MRVLIIGAGEVGSHLAKYLTKEAHDVTLVDRRAKVLQRVARMVDVQTVEGHGAAYRVLEKAGAEKADLVVAVTQHDEVNMVACMVARKLGARKTVVRVHATQDATDNPFIYKDILGFDFMISPGEIAAMEVMRVCRGQNAIPVENFAGGRLQMRRLELVSESPGVGAALANTRLPKNVMVTGVLRGADVFIPRGQFQLEVQDFVILIGKPESLDKAEKVLGGRRDLPKRVMINGGNPMAYLVARDLSALGVSVRVVVPEKDMADSLASVLNKVDIVLGEGTDLDLLNQEGIAKTDIFIALKDNDEVNLLACQLAKNLGAGKTMALISRGDYVALVDRLGIDHAVSPRKLVARRIAQFARGTAGGSITQIHHGLAEVVDRQIPETWAYVELPVKEIPLPENSVIGGVVRGSDIFVPKGDTEIHAGDRLLLFVLRDDLPAVEELLSQEAMTS